MIICFFFFSSRRRHTRFKCDWSSDVCSSDLAGSTFEDVAATGVPWWLQMYVTSERALTEPVVARAVDAGARALVLTADTPVVGTKREGERSVWSAVEPGWLRVNFAGRTGGADDPTAEKA